MTLRVKSNCWINPAAPNPNMASEIFATLVEFLTGSSGQACGVSLVESNWGRGGAGLNSWDTTSRVGIGAWAAFRFSSSSYGNFDMLVSVGSGSNSTVFGVLPLIIDGNTNPFQGGSSHGYVGVSFAGHPKGSTSVPWNGTTGSFVSGTLGIPVWKGDASGKIAVFPRNNSLFSGLGSYSSLRNFQNSIMQLVNDTAPCRYHFIMTEDSFTVAYDIQGATNSYSLMHFGSFTPRSGCSHEFPYVMLRGTQQTAPEFYTNVYGSTTTTAQASIVRDGAIAHPTLSPSGTRGAAIVTIGQAAVDGNIGGFNSFVNSGSYDVLPIYVGIRDNPDNGLLGLLNNLAVGYGMTSQTVDPSSGSAAFGTSTAASFKWITPWKGPAPGVEAINRSGREQ